MNARRFDHLLNLREPIEHSYGNPLEWDRMEGRKAARICEYIPEARIENEQDWDAYLRWFLDRQARLREAVRIAGGSLA